MNTTTTKRIGPITIFFCLSSLLLGCDQKAQAPSEISTSSKSEARSAAKEIPYKKEIEKGLAAQFNTLPIPLGDIQIMSGLSSQMEQADLKNKRFPIQLLEGLEAWKEVGLIEYTEQKQSELALIGSMGTRRFTVTPKQKAIDASDPTLSTSDVLYIPLGTCTVLSIVKDVEYQNPLLPQSDDFRLVVGTYRRSYNEFSRTQGASEDEVFKFRALMKVNPFNQTYSFQGADWGNIDEDVWKTQNIPN